VEVMEVMVRVAEGDDPRKEPNGGVVWGVDGVEAYAADIADMTKSGAGENEGGYFQGGWTGCHNIYPQMSGRPAAATYLKKVAPLFEDDPRGHIEAASAAYGRATEAWEEFERKLGRGVEDKPEGGTWQSASHRAAGAEAVREAAAHERDAVSSLTRALEAMKIGQESASLSGGVTPDAEERTGNSLGRGLAVLLRHAGCETDYPTVMGDTGQAFVTQGVVYDDSLSGGYADVGWWPLELWHMESRLPFLSDVSGCALYCQRLDFGEVSSNPGAAYRKHFEGTVQAEIAAERPLISLWTCAFVVTGYDSGEPQLKGWCLAAGKAEHMRADDLPSTIYTYGERSEPMDRRDVDRLALRHAIDLARGEAPTQGLWVTGPRAWKGWEDHLMQRGADTQARWHANMRMQHRAWRRCAIAYLAAMQVREEPDVSAHLQSAIDHYKRQIDVLSAMEISTETIVESQSGREALAQRIREATEVDARAVEALAQALAAMQG